MATPPALILLLACAVCGSAFAQKNEIGIAEVLRPDYAIMTEPLSENGGKRAIRNDGGVSPGERAYLDISVRNASTETISGLRAALSSDDQRMGRRIFLENAQAVIGNLAAGASASLTAIFSLDERCSDEPIIFKITFRDSQGREWIDTLSIPVYLKKGDLSKTFGRFSFYITNKIMEDGSIVDGGFGWNYTDAFSGSLQVRRTKIEQNEEFEGAEDSLNAVSQQIYEVFLMPLEYDFLQSSPSSKIWLGIGGYYSDETLKEKGFFNMPKLEILDMEPVNSYTNNFSMRILGPIIDAGFTFRGSEWFKASLSGGVVPIFATWAEQEVSIVPLLDPGKADYSQNHSGSPYAYMNLSGIISLPDFKALAQKEGAISSDWKIWFSLIYDYSRLQYEILDFKLDGNTLAWSWYTPEREVVLQSFKVEGALLIPVGEMHVQVGVGRIFDSVTVDSGSAVRKEKNYFNISGRLINF